MAIQKTKDWRCLEFYVPIETFEDVTKEGAPEDAIDFIIKGVAINETTTLNNVKYVAEELQKAAVSFRNVPILLDHKNEVKNIVGRTTEKVDFNSSQKRIEYEARIMDNDIKEMIKDGRIQSVSIGAKVSDLVEEEDGSMKAIGIHGLEISLVAVPGDNQANLAQALQNSFILKEMAIKEKAEEEPKEDMIDTELNQKKEVKMTEEETEVVEPVAEEEVVEEEVVEEPAKEEAEVKAPEEEVTDTVASEEPKTESASSDVAEIRKQLNELKGLLVKRKQVKEKMEKVKEDKTIGEVTAEEVELDKMDAFVMERARSGFAIYKDYSKEGEDTMLKRLVR